MGISPSGGFEHRGIQPIRSQGSIAISQSDFEYVGNRSETVFRHGDFAQWGFEHRGIQPIRSQGSIVISQSDSEYVGNRSERVFRHGDFAQKGFLDMGISPSGVLSIGEFNQSDLKAP